MMIYFLIFLISLYCLLLLVLIYGWFSTRPCETNLEVINNYYSVIVPARNEENNIKRLFHDLQHQDFPVDRVEIIFVNDHSDDSTVPGLEQLMMNKKRPFPVHLMDLDKGEGKKAALQCGIDAAKGSVIVTTDADCTMSPHWLQCISCYFENKDAEMVFGPVTFAGEDSIFEKIQTIEFASLIGTGAASLALGFPNMCNGANLAFRKEAFITAGGYKGNEHIPSGDDEFLMHKMHRLFPSGVFFNRSADALVQTKAHKRWAGFFHQRKRWAGKWKFYADPKTIFLAISIFLVNLSVIAATVLLFKDFTTYQWLLFPLLMKATLEGFFLLSVLKFVGKIMNPFLFIILQFTYPFYVILFGIAANFGKYTWKGRRG